MKISEALKTYRSYQQDLYEQNHNLTKQRDAAQKRAQLSGSQQDLQHAATLELSLQTIQEKLKDNQKVLDSLTSQWCAVANAEVARQQADSAADSAVELSKIMEVARRISRGDLVPYKDEKKLIEYNPELYQAAKQAAMLADKREREKYKSLWSDEEENPAERTDPLEVADNAEASVSLPDIAMPESAPQL